ncbi:serine/threonine-protein kinase [Gemmata sp. JC673]|uniref:Serine/threonine-protein kinase n=1 Tax=Gemmata algarum TaxID=2975278 RepID=A0ABU5EZ01_9BACT|nr:serine/threonine-protein kinase [Gemmata algarum]MDY3560538.1 serine/threonine-protein kinase [Gemmata algarum]
MTAPAPNTPPDQTAVSRPRGQTDDNTERDATAAADVTVVRVRPSAMTVTEIMGVGEESNFGKYQLDGELARGGMGVVYKARQKGLDRLVALKMILDTGSDKEAAQRFLQEARAAAALDHPNVVPIYDIDEIGGKPYFTMALIDGPNLRGYIDAHPAAPIPMLVSLFLQTVSGVAHAHRHGIVHRDLKPANVLIDKDERPRVTDFGLAKRASADAQLTTTGQVVGTPAYMAPEQARDSKEVGPAADVYSLGAILYFMLTGTAPFHADSVTDLLIKVVMEPPVPPRARRADVPADLEELCLRCLAKAPADRFADAQELLVALGPIADQYLTPSTSLTPSAVKIPFPKARTMPSLGSVPFANVADSVPSLGAALAKPISAAARPAPPAAPAAAVAPAVPAPVAPVEPAPQECPGRRTKSGKPVAFALAGVAAVLACVAAFLLTRDKPKAAEPEPRPAEAVQQAVGEAVAWPGIARSDFELKVDLSAPAAKKAADGSLQLVPGTPMKLHLKAAADCRVSVWVLEPGGQVTRLFPNDNEPDDRLTAGTERVVPGSASYVLETLPTDGPGHERLRVIATTGDQPPFPPGAKSGRFTTYSTPQDRAALVSTVRGVVVKKSGTAPAPQGAVSEAELLFRVQK